MARHVGTVAVIGFCWGGTLAWAAASEVPLAAAVCYYGGGIAEQLPKPPTCPTHAAFRRAGPIAFRSAMSSAFARPFRRASYYALPGRSCVQQRGSAATLQRRGGALARAAHQRLPGAARRLAAASARHGQRDGARYCWSTPARRRHRAAARCGASCARFLSDPRVVELPRALWLPLLYGLVLPLRAPRSAHKYRQIWQSEGSPLLLYTSQPARGAGARTRQCPRGGCASIRRFCIRRRSSRSARACCARPASGGCWCCRCFRRAAAPPPARSTTRWREALRGWRALPELRYHRRLSRRPGLHRRTRRQRARALAAARAQRPSADVVSRHSAVLRRARRSLRRGVPATAAQLAAALRAAAARLEPELSIALRRQPLAHPGHRPDAAGTAAPRDPRRHRDLPRVRGRLPRDARGDRAARPWHLPAGRRRALRLRAARSTRRTDHAQRTGAAIAAQRPSDWACNSAEPGRCSAAFSSSRIATHDIAASVQFYERLGFAQLLTGDAWPHRYGVLGDGRIHLGLHECSMPSPALTFVLPQLGAHVARLRPAQLEPELTRLGDEELHQLRAARPGRTCRDAARGAHLFAAAPAAQSANRCAAISPHLSLPQTRLRAARDFWERAGFVALPEQDQPYAHLPLTSDQLDLAFHRRALLRCAAAGVRMRGPQRARHSLGRPSASRSRSAAAARAERAQRADRSARRHAAMDAAGRRLSRPRAAPPAGNARAWYRRRAAHRAPRCKG